MAESAERLQQLQKEFSEANIPTDSPGFYEDREFVRREQKNPAFLDNYARFVQWQPYSVAYLEKAERAIHVVAEELQFALKEDGGPDAYAEAPLVMSRMLEREDVWNYVAHGGLTITLPPASGFTPLSFCPVDPGGDSDRLCGYRWVVAPPFQIIDIMIQFQEYPYPITHLLPKIVFEKDAQTDAANPTDILSPAAIDEARQAGLTPEEGIDRFLPDYRRRFAAEFPVLSVTRGNARLKYVPTGSVVAEASLEQFTGFVSQGRTASQIFSEKVRSRLSSQLT